MKECVCKMREEKLKQTKDQYGGNKMEINNVLMRETIGLREVRNSLSELFHFSVYNFKNIIIGNAKKGGKTATLISTDLLNDILETYKFNTFVSFDNETNQWEVNVTDENINADGCGDTKEDAINMLIDNILDLTEDYFENLELYLRIDNMKALYPYFLRIQNCNGDREQLIKVLNLQE